MLKANYEHATCFGVVEKLSGLGYKFNKRLLCLHDGVLSYYSKIPAAAATGNMNQSTLKNLNLKPKLSIEIKYIKPIKLADKNLRKKRDFVFVVEFTKAAFMTSNRKDSNDLKSDHELQWIFAVNDEENFKKWTHLLEQVRSEQDSSSQNSSFAIEDKLQKENSLNLEGVLHERNKEEEFRRKQEGEEKLKIEWEYNYNLLMNENMKALAIEDRVKTGFQLLRFIGKFRTEAVNLCKDIIDDLSLSRSEQRFSAYEKTDLDQNSKKSQRIFVIGEIIVRMTWTERERVDLDGDESSHYLYTDKVAKSYNHEFRAMDVLNDILYELNKNRQDVAYRVPLAVKVDYKGFKCLVISNPPLEGDEALQLGPRRSKGTYRANKNVDKDLKYIAKVLNLKEHTFVLDDKVTKVNVPLSILTEIHKVTFSYYEDDIRNSPFNEARLTFNAPRGHECFYFMKTADIFPVDIDLEAKKNPSFLKRLRPEFLYEYERPLSADALLNNTGDSSNYEDDDVEVAEAGIYLRTAIVPDFVRKLNSMEIIMTDSTSWTEALHCHGINMRYLGLICQQMNLPHVKKACITEMIARAVKKILNKEITDIVLHSSKRSRIFVRVRNSSGSKEDEPRKSERKKSQEVAETEEDIGDCVIEVLNLIFGKGEESTQFWSETMTNQIMHDFGYDIKDVQKTDINLGGLLLAVVHHCNINIKWDSSIEELLDKVPNPFNKSCYEGVKVKSKVYSMQNLEVKSSGERYKTAKLSQEYDVAINSCLLARSIDEHMAVKGESSKDPGLLGDMAEIYYETEQFDKAYEHAKEGLKYSRTLHVEAVKCLCVMMRVHMIKNEKDSALKHFEQAIKHLNFHVGLYHPMHAQIYNIFGSYYGQLAPKRY